MISTSKLEVIEQEQLVLQRSIQTFRTRTKEKIKILQYRPGSRVVCLYIVLEMLLGDSLNILGRSKNCSTKRSVLECSCVQMVEDNFLGLPLNLHEQQYTKTFRAKTCTSKWQQRVKRIEVHQTNAQSRSRSKNTLTSSNIKQKYIS